MKTMLFAAVAVAVVASQARDVARFPSGTAVLSGTVVVDEPSGQPVKRALIALSAGGDLRVQIQTATDDSGRFVVSGLPAGNIRLVASKPSYVTTYYGARQPGSTVGIPISVTNGQTTNVTVRMPRGAVIAGTITDENGAPMPGVGVRVQRVTMSAFGQRVFTPSTSAFIPSTDDRGAYRIFGLAAGDYAVTAQPPLARGGGEVRQTTAAELKWAEGHMRGGAASATATQESSVAPPASQAITYASVFYPGTVNSATAGIVSVAAGQERSGIDLRMQFVATARVEGTVTGADGQPARGVQVMLIPESDVPNDSERMLVMMEVGLMNTPGTMAATAADGSFSVQGVEPGGYTVLARVGSTAARGVGPASPPNSWAMTDVRVDGRDITGLAMRLAPGQVVTGNVVYEGARPPATGPRVTVSVRAATSRGIGASGQAMYFMNDGFTVGGLIPATYRITAASPGWTLKSAMLGGRDIADVPFEIKPGGDVSGLVVTMTESAAELSGVLYDAANRPSADLSIVLFSTDRAMWFAGSRRVRPVMRPASDGRFTFPGLVAGEYYLAALTDVQPNDLANPQFLEQVQASAIKVAIADGEKKVQDLKVAR